MTKRQEKMLDMMEDDFISALVDMEEDGTEWDDIKDIMKEYAKENGIKFSDLRRMYGDELKERGL